MLTLKSKIFQVSMNLLSLRHYCQLRNSKLENSSTLEVSYFVLFWPLFQPIFQLHLIVESHCQTYYSFQPNAKSWTKKTIPRYGKYGIRAMIKMKWGHVTKIPIQLASKWLEVQIIKIRNRTLFTEWLIKVDFLIFMIPFSAPSLTQF